MSKPMTRDPYLPSPEVCDWLLAQTWSEPDTCIIDGPEGKSEIYDCCQATAALGRDECIDLVLPAEGIKMLREDQRQRAEAIERKRASILADEEERKRKRGAARECESSSADPETVLLERILTEVAKTDLTAFQGIGILQTAATLMISRCYDLTNRGD